MSSSAPLDFAALICRNQKPASLTQITKNERKKDLPSSSATAATTTSTAGTSSTTTTKRNNHNHHHIYSSITGDKLLKKKKAIKNESLLGIPELVTSMDIHHAVTEAEEALKASELAYRLSLRTPAAKRGGSDSPDNIASSIDIMDQSQNNDEDLVGLMDTHSLEERMRLEQLRRKNEESLPCELHQVQLGDWESKINWEGVMDQDASSSSAVDHNATESNSGKDTNHSLALGTNHTTTTSTALTIRNNHLLPDPMSILSETFNPSLEAIDLDNLISWDGAAAPRGFNESLALKMGKLILQDGVAGLSIATKSGSIAMTLPTPFNQSEVYKRRMELKHNNSGGAAPSSSTHGTLQKDHAALAKEIQARQRKRAQMAIDKTNRVKGALGKLDLGGGTGRAITSSLMGPGGTERTGRPSRHNMSSHNHDATYVEQLDMVNNHTLVKADLSFGELRYYHRPLLPRKMFKPGEIMPWQFQVRVFPNANLLAKRKNKGADGSMIVSSYQNLNTNPGALSQSKIRNGADLSPSEGMLVVMEYSEQKPPVQMTKGMASKIINYYRGDRSKCPVSAGGGDRPLRKKKHGNQDEDRNSANTGSTGKIEKPPRLAYKADEKVTDLIGKVPNKKKSDNLDGPKEPKMTILPEGSTEILHAKDHGPFIGQIKDGVTQSGLISSLFAAPIFRHEPRKTDFLLILGKVPSKQQQAAGATKLPVVIRPMPDSIFCVGQTEPKTKAHPPGSSGERAFFQPFSVYQIAKALQRKHHGLRFEDIKDGLFPNTGVLATQLRLRIKKVAVYDKNTQIWTLKDIGFEDFPGVEALGREVSPEGIAANWESRAATLKLQDLGINQIYRTANGTTNLAAAMTYINGQIRAGKKRLRVISKLVKSQKKSKDRDAFSKAEAKLEAAYKALKRKGEVANFIFEALQLAPWQLTTDFIDVHKKGQGSGMMKLTGLGDPSGIGAAFNFIREVDGKTNKSSPNGDGALNARVKKITGTDKDLRKLNMTQMASILRSYGLPQKDIDKLKRWDRVHCIRDLSTKAASDNMADGLEKFARGEKMKLSDQKKIYSERIQEIWERQRLALSEEPGDLEGARGAAFGRAGDEAMDEEKKAEDGGKEEDSDDEDDDDFFNDMEDIFKDTEKTNELVSNQMREGEGENGAFRSLKKDGNTEMNKDAMELAAFQRQIEEERANRMDLDAVSGEEAQYKGSYTGKARKVIRRKITKTNPDGSQTITFKFILQPTEIKKALSEKTPDGAETNTKTKRKKKQKSNIIPHEGSKNPVGHALFEEEDEGGTVHLQVRKRGRGARRKSSDDDEYTTSRSRKTPGTKSRSRSTDKRPKRKRSEDEDAEFYIANARRKGTSNRKERGAARERMPHVMFSQRLEEIRLSCEKRPASGPFHRPVDKRCNVYYEKIKRPMDLQTIRDKINKYEYRFVQAFVNDFELMKQNAVTFNGLGSTLGNEATAIFEFVKETVEQNRADFDILEAAVDEQMNSNKKRGSRASTPKLPSQKQAGKTANVTIDGITTEVNLGDIQSSFLGNDSDSD